MSQKKVHYGDLPNLNETPKTIIAIIEGVEVSVPAIPGKSIVESLIEGGASPSFSCLHGSCMACMVELVEGEVGQRGESILDADCIERDEFLSCQAISLSETVKVNFDIC